MFTKHCDISCFTPNTATYIKVSASWMDSCIQELYRHTMGEPSGQHMTHRLVLYYSIHFIDLSKLICPINETRETGLSSLFGPIY